MELLLLNVDVVLEKNVFLLQTCYFLRGLSLGLLVLEAIADALEL